MPTLVIGLSIMSRCRYNLIVEQGVLPPKSNTCQVTQEEIDSLGDGKTIRAWEARFELAYEKC